MKTLGESWIKTNNVWKNTWNDILTEEKAQELYNLILHSAKVGIEIEGNCKIEEGMARTCGKTPQDCGKCKLDTCEYCKNCTPNNMNRCYAYGHPSCAAHRNSDDCTGCKPCDFCNRCATCNPCQGCEYSIKSVEDVYKLISKETKCLVGKPRQPLDNLSKMGDFLYVYNDSGCNVELVTNCIPLSRLVEVLEKGFKLFSRFNIKSLPEHYSGYHQTFIYKGYFPQIVSANVVQIVRYYYPALLSIGCIENTNRRGGYRGYPIDPGWSAKTTNFCASGDPKHEGIYVKSQNALAGSPSMLEFRYPDAHQNSKQHLAVASINLAIILKAVKMSKNGVVSFSNPHYKEAQYVSNEIITGGFKNNKTYVSNISNLETTEHKFIKELRVNMFKFLEEELSDIVESTDELIENINSWSLPVTNKQASELVIKLKEY